MPPYNASGAPPGPAGGLASLNTLTPAEFSTKMMNMFEKATLQGETALKQGGVSGALTEGGTTQQVADLAKSLFGGMDDGSVLARSAPKGYILTGSAANRTTLSSLTQQKSFVPSAPPSYVVQMVREMVPDGDVCQDQSQMSAACAQTNQSRADKQAQTFLPSALQKSRASDMQALRYSMAPSRTQMQDSTGQCRQYGRESLEQIAHSLKMSNDHLAGLLAKLLAPPKVPSPSVRASESHHVFTNFVAQMYAAGNITKQDASRMNCLITSGMPLRRQDDEQDPSSGGGGQLPRSTSKSAQCTPSQIEHMTVSQAHINCDQSKHVHMCGPADGCPSTKSGDGSMGLARQSRGMGVSSQMFDNVQNAGSRDLSATPTRLFTSTQVFTSASGVKLEHARSFHSPAGVSESVLCISASKPSVQGVPRCDSKNRLRPIRSKSSVRRQRSKRRNVCVTQSQPSISSIPRCPSATSTRPACVGKSKPSMPNIPRCKSRVCCPKSQPSVPGLPRCVPALPFQNDEPEPEPDFGGGDEPEPELDNEPPPLEPEPIEMEEEPPEEVEVEEEEEEEEPPEDNTSVRTPKSSTGTRKSEPHTEPIEPTPPMSESPVISPANSGVPSPVTEHSLSVSSHSPSIAEVDDNTEEEELEWPSTPPRGPLERVPSPPPEPPPPPPPRRTSKPGKNYTSPFRFQKIKCPEPDGCQLLHCLPECHPLRTPYPPQYRFDEVRMRRYMEQCHQLKKICSHPPGEQCWLPPPPPLPPELREKQPPYPPDRCHPPLFPGTDLGLGCSYGLPSGNCYGAYEKGGNRKKKPEDCYFDCGGICPMGLLGENCPQPPPYVAKPKKKQKKDEVFQFDYITVMREKAGPPEDEGDYCDQLKRQRRLQEKLMIDAAAAEQILADQCADGSSGRRGKRRGSRKSRLPEGPPPSDEAARFLERPDVQVVKEMKTEIVKTTGYGGPEQLVTQQQAYYTKTPDGRIAASELRNVNQPTVEDWMKQDADATLRKHNRGLQFTDECPVLRDDLEKEFREFSKSCGRSKVKPQRQKALPTGFLPCPLPEKTVIMCRVPDPGQMGGNNTLQCQAVPIPTGNVGQSNALQFGTEGSCVGGNGQGSQGMAGMQFVAPPGGYGGYVNQQQQHMQSNKMFGQCGLPPPPPVSQQLPPEGYLSRGQVASPTAQPYQQQPWFPPQGQQQQQSNSFQDPSQAMRSNQDPSQMTSFTQAQQQQSWPSRQDPSVQNQALSGMMSMAFDTESTRGPYQQSSWNAPNYTQQPNGSERYAPGQPVKGFPGMSSEQQEIVKEASVLSQPQQQKQQTAATKEPEFPYMCEIRYHEPIHGSIYGTCSIITFISWVYIKYKIYQLVIILMWFLNRSSRETNTALQAARSKYGHSSKSQSKLSGYNGDSFFQPQLSSRKSNSSVWRKQ